MWVKGDDHRFSGCLLSYLLQMLDDLPVALVNAIEGSNGYYGILKIWKFICILVNLHLRGAR